MFAFESISTPMRVVLQRVNASRVSVGDRIIASIGLGLVVFIGVGLQDGDDQVRYLAEKTAHLRIFEDQDGKMNRSIIDVQGEVIVVSQFTLYADTRKGRRPSFVGAAPSDFARPLVEKFANVLAGFGIPTQTGQFGASMLVDIANDGPVTIVIEAD